MYPLKKILKLKSANLTFAFNKEIHFTYNQADTEVRDKKTRQKSMGFFRAKTGGKQYTSIYSFISTVRKNNFNACKELSCVCKDYYFFELRLHT